MEKYLTFSVEEYVSRANKARELMAKAGLDACLFTKGSNIIYFSGYTTTLYDSEFRPFFFLLPLDKEPVLVVPQIEYGGALKTSWVEDVRTWGGKKPGSALDPVALLAEVVREKGLETANIGMEMSNGQRLAMTMEQFEQLKKTLPNVKMRDNDQVVWPCRMVKSPAEIEYMRKACKANDAAFEAIVQAIGAGVTEKEAEIAMTTAMVQSGAIPAFMSITAGVNRYDMTNPDASSRVVMKHGDMVVMDFGCRYERYYTDVTRGVFVGEVHPRAAELYKAVLDISHHALEAALPGNPVSAIDAASENRIKELGYHDLMLHRTGHSLGLEVHENPSIGPTETTILQPGMVLAIEPGLYDFSVGAFRMEDNIVITDKGWEFLTNASREIIVK